MDQDDVEEHPPEGRGRSLMFIAVASVIITLITVTLIVSWSFESSAPPTLKGASSTPELPLPDKEINASKLPPPDEGLSNHRSLLKPTEPPPPTQGSSTPERPLPVQMEPRHSVYRLSKRIVPRSYNLTVKPYLPKYAGVPTKREMTFDGEVEIRAKTNERVDEIELNMKELRLVEECCAVAVKNRIIKVRNISVIEEYHKVVFILEESIKENEELKIKISYTGAIITWYGFYGITYTDKNGLEKTGATTLLEQSRARRMVPCFDEPSFKATWTVTVIHPRGTIALSNGIEVGRKSELNSTWTVTHFKTTPLMSSYLLAVSVQEFEFVERMTKYGRRFRVWSQSQNINRTSYALDFGVRCLEFFEEYFGIKYPLDKLDFVALPQLIVGGEENWGLISYREDMLLCKDDLYTMDDRHDTEHLIAHELAHQWFGNLVTMSWWNQLWLKEGFADFMAFVALEKVTGRGRAQADYFISILLEGALVEDDSQSTHPLNHWKAILPDGFSDGSSRISYSKGASLLAMIAAIFGADDFYKGVKVLLNNSSYDTFVDRDLFKALYTAGSRAQKTHFSHLSNFLWFCEGWTEQMLQSGFPLITVRSVNGSTFEITQERYEKNPALPDRPKYNRPRRGSKWDVPLWYQINHEPVRLTWLQDKGGSLYISADTANTIIVVNAERYGLYRQNYDVEGWKKIGQQLLKNHTVYSRRTRNAIISDAFAAALAGRIDYKTVLDLIRYLKNETEYVPWQAAINGLIQLRALIGNAPVAKIFRLYIRRVLGTIYKNDFFDDLSRTYRDDSLFFDNKLKARAIEFVCESGATDCTDKYAQLFKQEVLEKCEEGMRASNCVKVAAPLRAGTYCYGVQRFGRVAEKKVMALLASEKISVERKRLSAGIACLENRAVLKKLMKFALKSKAFDDQDILNTYKAVASTPLGEGVAFNFFIENHERILKRIRAPITISQTIESVFSGEPSAMAFKRTRRSSETLSKRFARKSSIMKKIADICFKGAQTELHLEQAKNFSERIGATCFDSIYATIKFRIDWKKKNLKPLGEYFRKRLSETE